MKRISKTYIAIGHARFQPIASGGTSLILAALADGAGTTVVFPVAGVAFGDTVLGIANATASAGGVTITGYIDGAGTVGIRFQNETGGTVSLGTATWKYLVVRT